MFDRWGEVVTRWWFVVLGLWVAAFFALRMYAPPFAQYASAGEFNFLPEGMASRQAETLFDRAFPGRKTTSNIVIVAEREEQTGLTEDDEAFITDALQPGLEKVRDDVNALPKPADGLPKKTDEAGVPDTRIVGDIRTFATRGIGELLVSHDRKATLITLELAMDFQDIHNWPIVEKVETLISELQKEGKAPKGLKLSLTGSATLGRDLSRAEKESARNTSRLTIILVVALLLIIYRAPLVAMIPLLTLFVSVDISLHILALLAKGGYISVFAGLEEYTTVITYGPGIDYCLFLIARYKENLEECLPTREALSRAMGQVDSAILASAATVICGIGMLSFAQFGKFHEAGIGISLALTITLIATLTLTPAMLVMVGHWAFWPKRGVQCDEGHRPFAGEEGAVQKNLFEPMWAYMGKVIEKRPLVSLVTTLGLMSPLIVFGLFIYRDVTYGLIESLPKTVASAEGARALEKHFPAGITGPINVLIQNPNVDFRGESGVAMIDGVVDKLMKRKDELKIADIRSVVKPLGESPASAASSSEEEDSFFSRVVAMRATRTRSETHYVSNVAELSGHVTELEIIGLINPFAMESIAKLDQLQAAMQESLPSDQREKTTLSFFGPTASVRDVNRISESDQWRIYFLVVSCVLLILMVLLRSFIVSIYLMITVLMSFLATLGATWLLFHAIDPSGFAGLDWTVPLFLFVVLIAIGEDYNIFLVTRIHEEQERHGLVHGITTALSRTGGIITSCGFIMAGTFASLAAGSLTRMQQLGFALAFGVMLDTFVIRPVLVPAFLMILYNERYGLVRWFKKPIPSTV